MTAEMFKTFQTMKLNSNKQCRRKAAAVFAAAFTMMNSALFADGTFPFLDTNQPVEIRVEDLLSRLTLAIASPATSPSRR